ncbi:MAG: hypothetical protein VYE22_14915 [Myxococcota bacterium]|nr:hypothetical protein [Myxococcota bacterium]
MRAGLLALVLCASCGPRVHGLALPETTAGWTSSPLDDALAGCAGACLPECTVEVVETRDGEPVRTGRHWIGGDGRRLSVWEDPTGQTAHGAVRSGGAWLDAAAHVPGGAHPMERLLALMSRPGRRPPADGVVLTRTYSDGSLTWWERGSGEPEARAVRREEGGGAHQRSREEGPDGRVDAWAATSGDTRVRRATSPGGWVEEVEEVRAQDVYRERSVVTHGGRRWDRQITVRYGPDGELVSVEGDPYAREPQRPVSWWAGWVDDANCVRVARVSGHGVEPGSHSCDAWAERGDRWIKIRVDASGRPVELLTDGWWWVRVERDASGAPVFERHARSRGNAGGWYVTETRWVREAGRLVGATRLIGLAEEPTGPLTDPREETVALRFEGCPPDATVAVALDEGAVLDRWPSRLP